MPPAARCRLAGGLTSSRVQQTLDEEPHSRRIPSLHSSVYGDRGPLERLWDESVNFIMRGIKNKGRKEATQ